MDERISGILVLVFYLLLFIGGLVFMGFTTDNDVRKEAIDAGVAYYTNCGEFRWKEME